MEDVKEIYTWLKQESPKLGDELFKLAVKTELLDTFYTPNEAIEGCEYLKSFLEDFQNTVEELEEVLRKLSIERDKNDKKWEENV